MLFWIKLKTNKPKHTSLEKNLSSWQATAIECTSQVLPEIIKPHNV